MDPNTAPFDAPAREGLEILVPLAADTLIHAGVMVGRDANGRAVAGDDAATVVALLGRAQQTVDNTGGSAGAKNIRVRRGVFRYANSESAPLTQADLGRRAYVEDAETVAGSQGDHGVVAGILVGLEGDHAWVDTSVAPVFAKQGGAIAGATVAVVDNEDGTATATIQALDAAGQPLPGRRILRVWLAETAYGAVEAAATSVAAATGSVLNSHTNHGDLDVVTDADGKAVLTITSTDGAVHVNVGAGGNLATGNAVISGN